MKLNELETNKTLNRSLHYSAWGWRQGSKGGLPVVHSSEQPVDYIYYIYSRCVTRLPLGRRSVLNLRDNTVTTRRENESQLGAFLINKTVQQAHLDSLSLKLYVRGWVHILLAEHPPRFASRRTDYKASSGSSSKYQDHQTK